MNPFPPDWERAEIERSNGWRAKRVLCIRCLGPCRRTFIGKGGLQHYAHHWPCIALLGVSKGIRREASRILFSKHTWRISMPVDYHTAQDFDRGQRHWGLYHFKYYMQHYNRFKHIRLVFDQRDLDHCNALDIHHESATDPNNHVQNQNRVHRRYTTWLLHVCYVRSLIALRMTHVETIIFDLTNFFCPFGCCRQSMLSEISKHLGALMVPSDTEGEGGKFGGARLSRSPEVVRYTAPRVANIIGLLNDAEKDLFRNKWPMELVFKDHWQVPKDPEVCNP